MARILIPLSLNHLKGSEGSLFAIKLEFLLNDLNKSKMGSNICFNENTVKTF